MLPEKEVGELHGPIGCVVWDSGKQYLIKTFKISKLYYVGLKKGKTFH